MFSSLQTCILFSVVLRKLEEKLFVTTKEKENLEDALQIADKKVGFIFAQTNHLPTEHRDCFYC